MHLNIQKMDGDDDDDDDDADDDNDDDDDCERSVFVRRTVILFTYIFCGCSGISGNVSRAFFYFEFFFLSLGPFL